MQKATAEETEGYMKKYQLTEDMTCVRKYGMTKVTKVIASTAQDDDHERCATN